MTNYLSKPGLVAAASKIGALPDTDGLLYPMQPISADVLLAQLLFPLYPEEGTYSESKHIEGAWWEVCWHVYPDSLYSTHSLYKLQQPELLPDEHWLPHRTGHGGYVLRAYRVGCTHPHTKRETLEMHKHLHYCTDCGYSEVVWSD